MIKTEHDALTGEVIETELTAKEIAELETKAAAKLEAEQLKAAAKQAVLDKLGLTAEELKAALA